MKINARCAVHEMEAAARFTDLGDREWPAIECPLSNEIQNWLEADIALQRCMTPH